MRFSFFKDLPERRQYVTDYHADAPLIGKQAAELGVPTLVLTHLIPAPNNDADKQVFIDEVRSGGYEGELIVADDLFTAVVGSGGLPEVNDIDHSAEQQK
jgi:ribonuclease BN (tRNA processing enzyme)